MYTINKVLLFEVFLLLKCPKAMIRKLPSNLLKQCLPIECLLKEGPVFVHVSSPLKS